MGAPDDDDATPGSPASGFDGLLRALARADPRPPLPAALLHYRIVRKLGQGGMGVVYQARDEKLGRSVVLKLIVPGAAADEGARQRLLREARAASALNHPHIVTVHAVEQDQGLGFIVMEHVEGETLDLLLSRGPLDPPRALRLCAEVADALACAHAQGILHRDIKPANVMVTARGAKVLDFGLALRTGAEAQTAPGTIVGTAPYLSPEQVRGEALSPRSDVFALGCVLYEALAGRRAFAGQTLRECASQILAVDPPAPGTLAPGIPAGADAVVARALAKEPAQRTASAADLAAELRALVQGGAVEVGPATSLAGRARELAALDTLLARAWQGEGAAVFLTGEAGIGKSALADEVVRRAQSRWPPPLVGRGKCIEQFGAGEAWEPLYQLWNDALAGPFGGQVREALLSAAPSWSLQLPAAREGAPEGELERRALGATRERVVRELTDALFSLADRRPVLLVLEDLHWADPSTEGLLRALVQLVRRRRVLIVATLRPAWPGEVASRLRAELAGWRARKDAVEIPLGALEPPDVTAMLDQRFAPNDFAARAGPALWARTEGNPLFVVALIDRLLEEGRIRAGATGAWHLDGEAAALELPEGLRALLRKNLGALAPAELELLEMAAVQGTEFDASIASALCGQEQGEADERLTRIAARQRVLRALGVAELPGGGLTTRWAFAHVLYRDVLLEDFAATRRIRLHLEAGALLLSQYGARSARHAAELAMHFEQGRDFGRAVEHLLQAGENAMRVFAAVEAERHFDRALSCAARLPAPACDQRAAAVLRQRALALTATGRYPAALADLHSALVHARRCQDPLLEGAVHCALADVLLTAHRLEDAVPHAQAALAAADRQGDRALRDDALAMLALERLIVGDLPACDGLLSAIGAPSPLVLHLQGLLHYFWSGYAEAERCFAQAAARNEAALLDGLLLLESRMFLALAQANLGRLGEALRGLQQTLLLAERSSNAAMQARAGNSIGWIWREMGRPDRALLLDARAAEVGRAALESEAEANALVNLAEDRLALGQAETAAEPFPRVSQLSGEDPWLRWRYLLRLEAARSRRALLRGELAECERSAALLRERAAQLGAAKYVAVAGELLARAALQRGDLAACHGALAAARAALAARPSPLLAWKLEALAAEAAVRAGAPQEARAAADRAREGLRAIAGSIDDADRPAFLLAHPIPAA